MRNKRNIVHLQCAQLARNNNKVRARLHPLLNKVHAYTAYYRRIILRATDSDPDFIGTYQAMWGSHLSLNDTRCCIFSFNDLPLVCKKLEYQFRSYWTKNSDRFTFMFFKIVFWSQLLIIYLINDCYTEKYYFVVLQLIFFSFEFLVQSISYFLLIKK